MPEVMTREDQLVAAVLNCVKLRDAWLETGVPRITNDFAEAVDELVAVYDEGDIPGECRPLFAVFPHLKEEWLQYANYMSEKQPSPKPMFWNQLQLMEKLLTVQEERDFTEMSLNSVLGYMDDEKVPIRQIALIYSHKGHGPFMKNKQQMPNLVNLEYKHQKNIETRKDCEFCQKIDVQLPADKSEVERLKIRRNLPPCAKHGMQILPENFEHPAIVEMRQSGIRVEKRLQERAARLYNGSNGHVDHHPDTEVPVSESPEGDLVPEEDGPSEAYMTTEVQRLIGINPQVSNRDVSETLGIPVKEVQRIRRKITG